MTQPIPILFHESYFTQLYGAQAGLYTLLQYLDRNQFLPLVVCPGEGKFTERVRTLGIEVEIIPLPPDLMTFGGRLLHSSILERTSQFGRMVPHIRQLARFIRSHNVRLMHCNTIRSMVTGGWAARLTGIPLIWHIKGDGRHGYLDYIAFALSNKIVTISDDVKYDLDRRPLWHFSRKIMTIRDGIPLERFDPTISGEVVRREFGFADSDIVVGTVGALSPRKGYETFLAMANMLSEVFPHVKFVIVGDLSHEGHVPYKEKLLDLGRKLSEDGRLVFAGWRDDMPHIYAAMDILTLASSIEGLALVVVEAMAMAKPVARTVAAGANDTTVDRETGFLVPVNDPQALAEAVKKLVVSEDLRVRMGAAARDRAVTCFSAHRMARDFEHLFLNCLR